MRLFSPPALVLAALFSIACDARAQSGPQVMLAQTGQHGDGHAQHHDWYRELRQPDIGYGCCSDADCRPVRAWLHDDGQWRAVVEGRPVRIPAARILDRSAPDGGSHLCLSPAGTVYCFIRGVPKS